MSDNYISYGQKEWIPLNNQKLQEIVSVVDEMQWEEIHFNTKGGFVIFRDLNWHEMKKLVLLGFYMSADSNAENIKFELSM